jgi:hypothetical protein
VRAARRIAADVVRMSLPDHGAAADVSRASNGSFGLNLLVPE